MSLPNDCVLNLAKFFHARAFIKDIFTNYSLKKIKIKRSLLHKLSNNRHVIFL